MNSKIRNRTTLAGIILLCACSPALYIPSVADASQSGISVDSLMIGRNLYKNHCGSCHNLHLPEQYTQKRWEKEIPDMKRKAKISDNEAKLITQFIMGRSKPE